jgi:hypothetical protein
MPGSEHPQTWEYMVVSEAERDRLPELGAEGWELVAIGGSVTEPLLYLKRPGLTFRERVTLDQREAYLGARDTHAAGAARS